LALPDCCASCTAHERLAPQFCEMVWARLTHAESFSQAVSWLQQLCFSQVLHAVSVEAAAHDPPPLLPPLLLPAPHADEQLLVPQVIRSAKGWSCCSHCVQLPDAVQPWAHVTHDWSLPHAVAWVQHCWARQTSHAVVPEMAAHDPPPELELPPELDPEQLPDEPPPSPPSPPIPPPDDELQLLLPLLDEHPRSAATAAMVNVATRAMTVFIDLSRLPPD
jgi:hypothetical protein